MDSSQRKRPYRPVVILAMFSPGEKFEGCSEPLGHCRDIVERSGYVEGRDILLLQDPEYLRLHLADGEFHLLLTCMMDGFTEADVTGTIRGVLEENPRVWHKLLPALSEEKILREVRQGFSWLTEVSAPGEEANPLSHL